ncbi:MAG: rRNA processing protein RimM [Bacteroidota bacterium]|jgi:16S rRNA processing protein RimM
MENYLSIGKISATFGVKGELVLTHHLGEDATLEGVSAIFVEESLGKFIPYFVVAVKERNEEELLLILEGFDTPEKAKKFVKKKVWLREADVKKTASASAPISLLGFSMYEKKKLLGKVMEVIEQPTQLLLSIEINEKEVLVPINETTLERIDHKNQKIFVVLPEGLLDIYLT